MEMDTKSFPEGWKVVKLGDVCVFEYGKGLTKTARDESGLYNVFGSNGVVGRHTSFLVEEPVIIVGRKGGAGEVHLSLGPSWPIDTTYFVRQPNDIDLKFLFYQLKTLRLTSLDKSTAIPGLNRNDAYVKPFVVPPLSEQEQIVAKIEELFSELDAGKQEAEKALAQLKVYRQAVLKWAFKGRKGEYESCLLGEVVKKIQIGPFGSQLHREDYIVGGVPLINPMHISEGKIQPDESYSISPEKRDSLPNYILEQGDVIMGRRGEMGRCGLVTIKEAGWFCGTGSLYVRPKRDLVDSTYLYLYLGSDTSKKYLEANAGGTTMANLNLKIVGSVPIVLPPLQEQHRIVAEIERRLSVAEKIEETIAENLQRAEALRQSILKKAFEGRLMGRVPA